jgi:hypothetical protein
MADHRRAVFWKHRLVAGFLGRISAGGLFIIFTGALIVHLPDGWAMNLSATQATKDPAAGQKRDSEIVARKRKDVKVLPRTGGPLWELISERTKDSGPVI